MSDITKDQVIDWLSNQTVLEVADLVKELEEKCGVSAAAPVAVAAAGGAAAGGGEAAAEEKGKEDGAAFLADNAKKEGVTVTESGLQYEVITEGTGATPSAESTVRTHYHGMFTDGSVFDSSVDRGEPAEFPVGGVIAGWTEALQLMKEGSKWRLTIPYNLAYGEQGSQGAIPPFSTLVFEVELIAVL